jgi:thioredoxin reductase/Pyruvate/2-oxoacid:ferredoxin oxidoreductase delta subunit
LLTFGPSFYFAAAALLLGVFGIAWVYLNLRGRREYVDTVRLTESVAAGQHIPSSLHPIIDANRCIGSLSCIKACPEGDIIGLVDGKAKLVEASHCIGHARCAIDCPVDAITLVFGTKERGVELPETSETFETTKPGVFVVGELGGMGLIKNAIKQGLQVGSTLKARADQLPPAARGYADVVIVGAGPAGIATAVACREAGLTYQLLEQGKVGGTVANFPRGKVVMSEKLNIPGYGAFGRHLLSKEELMEELHGVIARHDIRLHEGVKVTGLQGQLGAYAVQTSRGAVGGRLVVLALGLRGTPRKIGCPGEASSKVTYALIDPQQYVGRHVLVVGGGDSAVEAAIQLAEETDARVSISYRKPSFARCKPRNRELIAGLAQQGRIDLHMSTTVDRIDDDQVHLKDSDGDGYTIWNDNLIVCAGGEMPTPMLKAMGVSVRTYRGEPKSSPAPGKAAPLTPADKANRRLGWVLAFIGLATFVGLSAVGTDYYTLPADERRDHALHELLKPAGLWGHGVGIVATLFMMSNFIYVIRKRLGFLKGLAPIRTWLTFHMFVGIMSPVVIAFHAAFQARNLLAIGTWVALAIVVGTGVFGRFVYGLIPSSHGKLEALVTLEERWVAQRSRLRDALDNVTDVGKVRQTMETITRPPPALNLFQLLTFVPRQRWMARRAMASVRPFFVDEAQYVFFRDELRNVVKVRLQIAAYRRLKRFFRLWLAAHVSLALFMVVLIGGHIALSLYLGYAWIFTEGA